MVAHGPLILYLGPDALSFTQVARRGATGGFP